ncbi:peptidase, partial [Staphylococcus sp. 231237_7MaSpsaltlick]
ICANGNDIFGQKEYPASYQETISIGVMKNEKSKSIFNSNDNADLYISLNNHSEKMINNTSEATALATNRLIKKYKSDFSNMDKQELITLIKEE